MSGVEFFEPMRIPSVTHNDLEPRRGKGGKWYVGKTARLREAEETWEAHLAKHAPERPLTGALYAHITFCYEARDPKLLGHPKVTKPDLDNLEKTVTDAMERLGWFASGDQQIAQRSTTKGWNMVEGVFVSINEMGSEDESHDDAA